MTSFDKALGKLEALGLVAEIAGEVRITEAGRATLTDGAQIVFIADASGTKWRGRLLRASACIDATTGKPVTWTPRFDIEEFRNGFVRVTIQAGASASGRRYTSFPSVMDAQKAGIRWAARRFRIPREGL
jgi:hypothetical protein